MASASWDKTVKVWKRQTGFNLFTFSEHNDKVQCVDVCPDGKWVFSGGNDNNVQMRSIDPATATTTETRPRLLSGHNRAVFGVALSPDGLTLASGSEDRTIKIWSTGNGRNEATLEGHSDNVLSLSFSSDGQLLASSSQDGQIHIWKVRDRPGTHPATPSLRRTISNSDSDNVSKVAFLPGGMRLASGSLNRRIVKVWNTGSGGLEMELEGHTGAVLCVAAFPDGSRIVSGSDDTTLRIWNLHSYRGNAEHILRGHSSGVTCVAVSRDGETLVSGSKDKTVRVWKLT